MFNIHPSSFTNIDWIALSIVLLGTFWGLMKGLVKELMSIAAWIVALVLSPIAANTAGSLIPVADLSPSMRYGAGYLLVFIAILITSTLLASLLRVLLQVAGLGLLDRVLGAVFGMLGATVFLLVLTICINKSPFRDNEQWSVSNAKPLLLELLHRLILFLPPDLGRYIS